MWTLQTKCFYTSLYEGFDDIRYATSGLRENEKHARHITNAAALFTNMD